MSAVSFTQDHPAGVIQRNTPQQIASGGNGCMSADARRQRRRQIIGPMMTTQQRDDARPINSDTDYGGSARLLDSKSARHLITIPDAARAIMVSPASKLARRAVFKLSPSRPFNQMLTGPFAGNKAGQFLGKGQLSLV